MNFVWDIFYKIMHSLEFLTANFSIIGANIYWSWFMVIELLFQVPITDTTIRNSKLYSWSWTIYVYVIHFLCSNKCIHYYQLLLCYPPSIFTSTVVACLSRFMTANSKCMNSTYERQLKALAGFIGLIPRFYGSSLCWAHFICKF